MKQLQCHETAAEFFRNYRKSNHGMHQYCRLKVGILHETAKCNPEKILCIICTVSAQLVGAQLVQINKVALVCIISNGIIQNARFQI